MITCPLCDSESFYYVQPTIEYWTIDHIEFDTNYIELLNLEDTSQDSDIYPNSKFWCEECGHTFTLPELEKILNND